MRSILVLVLAVAAVRADTIVLDNGLSVSGEVARDGATWSVTADGKRWVFPASRVRIVERGDSWRELYAKRAAALGDDPAEWYRLALWARESNLPQAREAFERVIALDPDHRAARRELGFERIGEEWVTGDEAMRRKGFVLCRGKWVLPAEADRLMRDGLMEQAEVTAAHRRRADEIVAGLLDGDEQVRALAAGMLDEVPDAALLRPIRPALYAEWPDIRALAVKTLSRTGDRVALPWLIRTSMYDADPQVRAAAYRAVKGFGDGDVFFPYARALYSESPKARVMAAGALAALGDMRGVNVILHRVSVGIGESPRVNLMVGKQQSYIQDFDVEIAQAAAIGDPIVQTIRDGVILDYKVLGGHGEAWVVEERNAYAGALRDLTGRDFGENWGAWAAYAEEQGYPRAAVR